MPIFNLNVNPTGDTVYLPDPESANVYAFQVKKTNGALTELADSPFATEPVQNDSGLALTNKLLVTGNRAGGANSLQVFKRLTSGRIQALGGPHESGLNRVDVMALTPNGKTLVIGSSDDEKVRTYQVDSVMGSLPIADTKTAVTGNVNQILVVKR